MNGCQEGQESQKSDAHDRILHGEGCVLCSIKDKCGTTAFIVYISSLTICDSWPQFFDGFL